MLSIRYHSLYHQKKSFLNCGFNKKGLVSVSFFYVSFLLVVSKTLSTALSPLNRLRTDVIFFPINYSVRGLFLVERCI